MSAAARLVSVVRWVLPCLPCPRRFPRNLQRCQVKPARAFAFFQTLPQSPSRLRFLPKYRNDSCATL